MKEKRLEIKLPADVHEALRARAYAEKISIAEIVRGAVEKELKVKAKPKK